MKYRTVQFQEISLDIPKDFISPDWRLVIKEKTEWNKETKKLESKDSIYQEYLIKSVENKIEPLEPQPFIMAFCKMLENINMREGRDAEMWFKRLVSYNGYNFLEESLEKMKNDLAEVLEKDK